MIQEKCIAAIATPSGTGGLSVIRVSGMDAFRVAEKVFEPISGKSLSDLKGYTAAYGNFIDKQNNVLDDGVALVFRGPKSYTGEDVVELSCHGGIAVTRCILRLLFESGAAPAQPGEFTRRAFMNGKMSLTQAEAVADLIQARSDMAFKTARAVKQGATYRKIHEICNHLIQAGGHLQAWLDYPEEDIEAVELENMQQRLNKASGELGVLLERFDHGKLMKNGISVAIIGKPNVGKSTLMNLLTGFETSIVTNISGTTRDVVEQEIQLEGIAFLLRDTAGIHQTEDPVERIGVERARDALKNCALMIAMFDSSRPLEQIDFEVMEKAKGVPSIAVINKKDCGVLRLGDDEKMFKKVIYTSKEDKESIEELKKAMIEVCRLENFDSDTAVLANERQRIAAQKAKDHVDKTLADLKEGMTWDAIGVMIDEAINDLLELTGENASEAVVNQVFSHFCVGK